MGVLPQYVSEKRRAGGEDHLVCRQLFILAGKSHIEKVLFFPQLTKCLTDIRLKVVPPKAKLLQRSHNAEMWRILAFSAIFNSWFQQLSRSTWFLKTTAGREADSASSTTPNFARQLFKLQGPPFLNFHSEDSFRQNQNIALVTTCAISRWLGARELLQHLQWDRSLQWSSVATRTVVMSTQRYQLIWYSHGQVLTL